MIITIDGPAASGKSTAGRALAKRLGFFYLYSGILFRAVAYLLVNKKGYTKDQLRSPNPVDVNECLDPEYFEYTYDGQGQERVLFQKEDITPVLKDSYIDEVTSLVAQDPHVRQVIQRQQRQIAKNYDVVTEGRDMGSVVFPAADFKFYLTADVTVRAARWRALQAERGEELSLDEALEKLQTRDERDMTRELSPLRVPEGAIVIDNSALDEQETIDAILGHLELKHPL